MKTKNLFLATIVTLFGVVMESSGQGSNVFLPGNNSTRGGWNILLGNNAGFSIPNGNTSNWGAVYLGQDAGYSTLFSGSANLLGYVYDTGTENIFLGYYTGRYNTTGALNTFVGSQAGLNNTTGSFSTGVGYKCGGSGNMNSSLGWLSGSGSTGHYNTYLGFEAGANNTGSNNVCIGFRAGKGSFYGSNKLIIAGKDTPNELVFGEFDTRKIKFNVNINSLTPYSSFVEINGSNFESGLRFTNLKSGNTALTGSGKVLSVNSNGDVILVNDQVGTGGTGGGISNNCLTANFITKSVGASGNLTCASIYDDGLGHVGFGFGSAPNTSVNVSVNGSFASYGGTYNVSDKKFKKDIKTIDNALEKIMNLEGKTYNWRRDEFKQINFTNELQYGLIAQEVEKVIPSLVLKDEKGDLAMNYIGLIPILIEAIKDQQTQINDLKAQLSENFKAQNQDLIELNNTKIINVSPNPSNNMVTVSFNIEKSVQSAKLNVYDLNGNVISSLNVNNRENNITRTLQKDNFGKGIYIVSLVINGKSIDTKKIVFN